jgi:type IV pili sensor histidine kinase/response regulator
MNVENSVYSKVVRPLVVSMTLSCSSVVIASNLVESSSTVLIQVGRYSVINAVPSKGQLELLSVTVERSIPDSIEIIGDAVDWLLEGSGYRMADHSVLSREAKDLLNLPLPTAHRQFPALPLRQVLSLIVGPEFSLVHDPVHRLLAFDRCRDDLAVTSEFALIKKQ